MIEKFNIFYSKLRSNTIKLSNVNTQFVPFLYPEFASFFPAINVFISIPFLIIANCFRLQTRRWKLHLKSYRINTLLVRFPRKTLPYCGFSSAVLYSFQKTLENLVFLMGFFWTKRKFSLRIKRHHEYI